MASYDEVYLRAADHAKTLSDDDLLQVLFRLEHVMGDLERALREFSPMMDGALDVALKRDIVDIKKDGAEAPPKSSRGRETP